MIAQNNVTHLFVCSNTAAVTTAIPTVVRTMGVKKIGEQLCSVEAIVAGDGFQVQYLNAAGKLELSPVLFWNNLVSKSKVAATSDVAQSVAVGYNGTSGAIEVNNGGEYLVTIGYKDGLKQYNSKRFYKYGQYTADASATQYEIVNGIQTTLLASIRKDPYVMFKVEKINSGAQLNAMASATAAVTNGSKVVTLSEDESVTCPAGSFIRFGTSGAGAAPVYKVESISVNGLTVVLDQPYQGATAAVFAHATIETLTEGDWGLLITAMDSNKPFEVGKWSFSPLRFDVGLSVDFGATPVTVITSPVRGAGTYKDIAEIEWFLAANRREAFRIAEYPLTTNYLGATSGETYTTYTLNFKEGSTKTIGGTADSFITLMVCSAGATLTADLDTLFVF